MLGCYLCYYMLILCSLGSYDVVIVVYRDCIICGDHNDDVSCLTFVILLKSIFGWSRANHLVSRTPPGRLLDGSERL